MSLVLRTSLGRVEVLHCEPSDAAIHERHLGEKQRLISLALLLGDVDGGEGGRHLILGYHSAEQVLAVEPDPDVGAIVIGRYVDYLQHVLLEGGVAPED